MKKNCNILIIGNGFDIAHELPTKYTDFLMFLDDELFKSSKAYKRFVTEIGVEVSDRFNRIRENILSIIGKDNQLLLVIQKQWRNNIINGEDWVDFEQTIAKIIHILENQIVSRNNGRDDITADSRDKEWLIDIAVNPSTIEEEFYRLLYSFEYYIFCIVNNIPIKVFSEDIQNIKPDIIVSLNYSNTYARHYCKYRDVDYIHGKANLVVPAMQDFPITKALKEDYLKEFYRDENHIVLGMDEYLSEELVKENTNYIGFRKYFQRISKRTGCRYKRYINEADKLNVIFYGHSIDPTDSELIFDVTNHKNAKLTIFYHDENAHIKEITNLVRILGKQTVIDKCDGENPSIVFKKQTYMKKLDGDYRFRFIRALESLGHYKCLSKGEFDKLFNELSSSIISGRGIETQNEVINTYALLYAMGIHEEYKETLIKLLQKLPSKDDRGNLCTVLEFDPESWAEPDMIAHCMRTPDVIVDFVKIANRINTKRFEKEGQKRIRIIDKPIHEYERTIPSVIEKEKYLLFLKCMSDK